LRLWTGVRRFSQDEADQQERWASGCGHSALGLTVEFSAHGCKKREPLDCAQGRLRDKPPGMVSLLNRNIRD
jgi:hypothetical protein